MKHQTNDLLRSALAKVNRTLKSTGLQRAFDLSRIRSDFSPSQNMAALRRLLTLGRFELVNDVNSGVHSTGVITRVGDAAIAQYLLVQKAASLVSTNVAVFTSGNPFGITLQGGVSATEPSPVRLLSCGQGTVMATSDGSAAIAVGDLIVGVSGGKVKTNTATGAEILIVGVSLEVVGNSATSTDAEFEMMPTWNNKSV
jgi:hypothetical protein